MTRILSADNFSSPRPSKLFRLIFPLPRSWADEQKRTYFSRCLSCAAPRTCHSPAERITWRPRSGIDQVFLAPRSISEEEGEIRAVYSALRCEPFQRGRPADEDTKRGTKRAFQTVSALRSKNRTRRPCGWQMRSVMERGGDIRTFPSISVHISLRAVGTGKGSRSEMTAGYPFPDWP